MKKIYLLFIAILFTSCSQNQNYLLEEGVVDIDYLRKGNLMTDNTFIQCN